jgi:Nucleotidyl transferase AbiEii toxin, Type IV TA system
MSSHYYKDKLYPLQDRVLQLAGTIDSPFYLTGGTLLGRFLLNHRYSDDLDFFVNDNSNFSHEVKRIMAPILAYYPEVNLISYQDSFVRYVVVDKGIQLKVEFINDVRYRVGQPNRNTTGILMDTWMNVLSNKVTALSRNAAKDIVDIVFLSLAYSFNWEEVFDHAKKKDASINEIDASKCIIDFDLNRFNEVSFPETFDATLITKDILKILAKESLHGYDNSLYGRTLYN